MLSTNLVIRKIKAALLLSVLTSGGLHAMEEKLVSPAMAEVSALTEDQDFGGFYIDQLCNGGNRKERIIVALSQLKRQKCAEIFGDVTPQAWAVLQTALDEKMKVFQVGLSNVEERREATIYFFETLFCHAVNRGLLLNAHHIRQLAQFIRDETEVNGEGLQALTTCYADNITTLMSGCLASDSLIKLIDEPGIGDSLTLASVGHIFSHLSKEGINGNDLDPFLRLSSGLTLNIQDPPHTLLDVYAQIVDLKMLYLAATETYRIYESKNLLADYRRYTEEDDNAAQAAIQKDLFKGKKSKESPEILSYLDLKMGQDYDQYMISIYEELIKFCPKLYNNYMKRTLSGLFPDTHHVLEHVNCVVGEILSGEQIAVQNQIKLMAIIERFKNKEQAHAFFSYMMDAFLLRQRPIADLIQTAYHLWFPGMKEGIEKCKKEVQKQESTVKRLFLRRELGSKKNQLQTKTIEYAGCVIRFDSTVGGVHATEHALYQEIQDIVSKISNQEKNLENLSSGDVQEIERLLNSVCVLKTANSFYALHPNQGYKNVVEQFPQPSTRDIMDDYLIPILQMLNEAVTSYRVLERAGQEWVSIEGEQSSIALFKNLLNSRIVDCLSTEQVATFLGLLERIETSRLLKNNKPQVKKQLVWLLKIAAKQKKTSEILKALDAQLTDNAYDLSVLTAELNQGAFVKLFLETIAKATTEPTLQDAAALLDAWKTDEPADELLSGLHKNLVDKKNKANKKQAQKMKKAAAPAATSAVTPVLVVSVEKPVVTMAALPQPPSQAAGKTKKAKASQSAEDQVAKKQQAEAQRKAAQAKKDQEEAEKADKVRLYREKKALKKAEKAAAAQKAELEALSKDILNGIVESAAQKIAQNREEEARKAEEARRAEAGKPVAVEKISVFQRVKTPEQQRQAPNSQALDLYNQALEDQHYSDLQKLQAKDLEIAALREQLVAQQRGKEQQISLLQEALTTSQQENMALKTQLEKLTRQKRILEIGAENHEWEIRDLEAENDTLKKRVAELERLVSQSPVLQQAQMAWMMKMLGDLHHNQIVMYGEQMHMKETQNQVIAALYAPQPLDEAGTEEAETKETA